MPDLTELVLTGGFAAALGIFAFSALGRLMLASKPRPVELGDSLPVDAESPYEPPREVVLPPAFPLGRVSVWYYRPWDLSVVAMVFGVFAFAVLSSLHVAAGAGPALGVDTLIANIGFQVFMVGMVASSVVWRVGWVTWLGLRWPGWPWVFLIAPGSVVFMWVVFACLKLSGYTQWMESFGVETVQETVKLLQKSEDPLILGLMTAAAVIAAPVCEEVVFRGYFYPVLKKYAGAWPAAVCVSLVFASAHGNLTALLPLFILGGLLVLVYEKTGSLWAPIAVHCCFNSATVLAQFAARYFHIPLDAAS